MSEPDETRIRAALDAIVDPHTGADLGSAGVVRAIGVDGGRVAVELRLGYPAAGWRDALVAEASALVRSIPGVEHATVGVGWKVVAHRVQEQLAPMPEVRNIIAIASGKGGVGKSTTAVNLALALQAEGARVGVLDADIYGPSIPMMLGLEGRPESPDGRKIIPKRGHGLQAMSIGLLVGADTPMIWRGPMVTQAMQQLLTECAWDDLDYLLIDLPPGTGDIQLTLAQRVPLSAAIIVTTPQDIALLDAKRALQMFRKVEVPVLGIIENMAVHVCSNCGHEEHVFGSGGGARISGDYDVPLLGALPLDIRIREHTDRGTPSVVQAPDSAVSQGYRRIARTAAARLSTQARNRSIAFPDIIVQDT